MLDPLKSEPALVDLVLDRLVGAISDGRLPPGARLTQGHVADLLDVSRQPVSHALQMLKYRGLAVPCGRKGLAVAPIDADQIWHLYQVRASLDGLAARLAASRVASGFADAAEIAASQEALDLGDRLDTKKEVIDFVRADVAFHKALHNLSGNQEIARTVAEQWPQFMRSMAAVLGAPNRKSRVWEEHAEIFAAIMAGDADRAERLATEHAAKAGAETRERINLLEKSSTAAVSK
jgi:DNA-binding GntR family transcriptional regulator